MTSSAQQWIGEAPGRIDVLGGVADYSGSLVLEMPMNGVTRVAVSATHDDTIRLQSVQKGTYTIALGEIRSLLGKTTTGIRERFETERVPHWTRYSLGCLLLFGDAMQWWPESGLAFEIDSAVPASMGVSSSAALEVATLRALEKVAGKSFSGTVLARMAQQVENEIVGAPCGLMDQLASAHGVPDSLLPILCRPDLLSAPVPLPDGVIAVGWPSGVKHAISDSPYATARAAAFMGKKVLETALGVSFGFLTELRPSQARVVGEDVLPQTISGADFLARYGNVDDALTTIEPERVYPLRAGALFPIEENFRCEAAAVLLRSASDENRIAALQAVGELMFQSHAGYTSIGLGHPTTDAMVEAVRKLGSEGGFYGARVSGGGSGGTVVVLLERDALAELQALASDASGPAAEPSQLIW
ncbi:MAG TPA: hypothetical protein VF719_10900 [Abditibacteriaceae bacterium]